MTNSLNDFTQSTADWRETLRQNNLRTKIIIAIFFLIYLGIGLLIDTYLEANHYPHVAIADIFTALVTFKLFPIATIIMLVIASVSLFVSYAFYDRLMLLGTEYHEITPQTAKNTQEQQLYNVVEEMKIAASLPFMPRVFIIDADYMNAFATGYSEKSAMVAITRGLMQKLNRDELQAVMAHELSHVKNLDIKITLTATLLSNLSIMVLDFFFYQFLFSGRESNNKSRNSLGMIIVLLRYILPIISVILLLYLSRKRELMADAGCIQLMRTNEPLASALIKINTDYTQNREAYTDQLKQTPHENTRQAAYLFDPNDAGVKSFSSLNDMFSTHPSLAERLAAIGYKQK